MIETLSLGGGIVTVNSIDMGFCPSFDVNLTIEHEYKEIYLTDGLGGLIRANSTSGTLSNLQMNGTLVCESLDARTLDTLWLRGTALLATTGFSPIVVPLLFVSSPATGPTYTLTLPLVSIAPTGSFTPIDYQWNNISFTFEVKFDGSGAVPGLSIVMP